jgi:hypothetical protein
MIATFDPGPFPGAATDLIDDQRSPERFFAETRPISMCRDQYVLQRSEQEKELR